MPFFKFGPANWESIGNIHRVSNWVFSVSSYILVLRSYPHLHVASLLPSVFENLATGLAGDKIWASHLRSPVVLDDVGLQQARTLLENLWAVWAGHVLV